MPGSKDVSLVKVTANHFGFLDEITGPETPMLDMVSPRIESAPPAAAAMPDPLMAQTSATPVLSLVVPCYNEEAALPETLRQLRALLDRLTASGRISPDSHMLLVDDGSRDKTWAIIAAANTADPRVRGLKLSRNCGHQNALLAGLLQAQGDVIVSLDADLQDDLEAIDRMLEASTTGADIVYGVRSARDVDTAFKRTTARAFYRLQGMLGVQTIADHADFRLMSRRAVRALAAYGEVNLFLRGIVPMLGFKTATVTYERKARIAGTTHYPFFKMLKLAADGILAFSTVPLQLILIAGLAVSTMAIGMAAWAFAVRLLTDTALPGWASVVIPLYVLGGLQMLALGIMGGYIARIYNETKQRPRFTVETVL
jgi:glycosyltransferase involved in cell wall biosynthesis